MHDNHLQSLNNMQREAALYTEGPLLVLAGAGAGKTKTITQRIINLIKKGVAPETILAVTFTNKAAKEMRDRVILAIEKDTGGQDSIPFISTFHSLGVHIIKENVHLLGLTKYFNILDDGDTISIIKESIKESDLDPKQYEPRKIKNIISREKNNFTLLEEYKNRGDYMSQVAGEIWEKYEKKKSKENSLDFDDLLVKSVELLQKNEEVKKRYQNKWKYLHIDEYQDTNEVQHLLSSLLAEEHKNICVVGDPDQLIYGWRGANLKNVLNFDKQYANTKIITLEENYRSTQNILHVANQIIKKNKYRAEKNLFTKNKEGEKISLYEAIDEGDEADFVATKILELLDNKGGSEEYTSKENNLSEIAILYRANFQSRVLEEAMLKYNIPYQVLGIKFFERKEIKDTLAYLRASLNRESLSDIKRIINFPKRGIGKSTLAKIFAKDTETLPAKTLIKLNNFYKLLDDLKEKIQNEKTSEVIKYAVRHSGIEAELQNGTEEDLERLANIKELVSLALKYDEHTEGRGIEKLLEDASLSSDQDSLVLNENKKEQKNAVRLMTIHASKGLEFENVFITGLEDGLFPSQRDGEIKKEEDQEEERRLFYVALTRAKKKVFLSFANFRTIFGSKVVNAPSEFIYDVPGEFIETEGEKVKTIYL